MYKTIRWVLCTTAWLNVAIFNIYGQETGTNTTVSAFATDNYLIDTNRSTNIRIRFWEEMIPISQRRYYDEFGHVSDFRWVISENRLGYGIHAYSVDRGRSLMRGIVSDSLRETALGILPVRQWRESTENGGNIVFRFLTGLFAGSLGNTVEEDVPTVSSVPSYGTLRRLPRFDYQYEWHSSNDTLSYGYGWKLLRPKPYLYAESHFGHYDDRPILITSIRCYGDFKTSDLGVIKLEPNIILLLTDELQVVVGATIYPTEKTWEHASGASCRLEYIHKGCVAYFGMTTDVTGQFYNVGYYFDF